MNPCCIHGHELTPENIVVRHGRERCRTCERIHGARYREKQRLARAEVSHDAAGLEEPSA
jgi:hypothetical protein